MSEELVERFELAFNQIHQHLKEMNGFPKNDNFAELLNHSKDRGVVREFYDALRQYAKLRNAIVHERVRGGYYIASPHVEVVEELEEIKRTLDQPPLGLDVATRPVMFFYEETELLHVIEAFREHGVSQFPIYREGAFVGLLTDAGVVRWLRESVCEGSVSIGGVTVGDVLRHEKVHNVEFMPADVSVFEVEELFERSHGEGEKLKAVMITEGGDRDGKLLGIVTLLDLILDGDAG
ncbi:CBS domain-containing protein [Halobacillus shinanisalinarum]|uniref:CBS domain-containing protein n=1 Tax=Halobacillus shinanisalinarum TaxID=2932258 RepID=A0ABY4H3I5_9BACI|nr:CBS domain-containing protein [Halobacillus shinanisalinarum]UOQ94914.1 CBS domain-containing protein [Halobacillus shinanisalinarum]